MPGGNATRWSDQVETMAKTWTEAQKKLWENWYHLASAAPAPPIYADVVDEWRKVAAQGFETWTATAEPTTQGITERLVASQKNFMEFLQFLADAWKAVASRAEAGEDWQNNLKLYTEQFRQKFFQAPEAMSQVNQDLNELWRLYLDQWNKLAQPWLKSSQLARGHLGQAITGNGSELIAFANLYWDAYERSFGRLVESPSLGYTRELNEKLLKSFDAWRDFRQASFEYQVTLADTWIQAFDRMIREMVSLAAKGQPIQSLRQLAELWNNVADPVFIEVFRSKNYIQIQGRLLNTAMSFRLHQREITELYLKALDIPTRSEVDEAHRHIYEQRKEIKTLKRTIAENPTSIRREREETGRTIEALQQEIKALKESLAVVIAEVSSLSADLLPVKASPPATRAVKPKAKKKPATAQTAPASSQEGGETR